MEYPILPLFKTHYSLGKSILTLEKPTGKKDKYPISVFDLLIPNKISELVLVEDNISGLLQASQQCEDKKIKLIFGLRISLTEDISVKDEKAWLKEAKYIIFAKNSKGYKDLISIWSKAAQEGFYYYPRLDFKILKKLWTENLVLVIPFYDSFLFANTLESHVHIPEIETYSPVFLLEDNDLPFDALIREKVEKYCSGKYETLQAQSIFYSKPSDFLAYLTFRCIHNRGHSDKSTLEEPNMEHMGSNTFNFERWLKTI